MVLEVGAWLYVGEGIRVAGYVDATVHLDVAGSEDVVDDCFLNGEAKREYCQPMGHQYPIAVQLENRNNT